MTTQVVMPKIGLTMTEGKIVEWRKKEGDRVEKGDILFVFETEKVTYEVEAQQSGFLAKILARVDDVVPVGKEVGILAEKRGEVVEPAAVPGPPSEAEKGVPAPGAEKRGRVRATPMARRLARERGIDIEALAASGSEARIKMGDIEAVARQAAGPGALPEKPERAASPQAEGRLVRLSGMRRLIAEKMLASKTEAAQTYMVVSADATHLMEARQKLAPFVEKTAGVRPTITDILMKIAAAAISMHPVMNTRWSAEGILWIDPIHMGMAMALEEGLIVPVVWDIGKKSLSEIAGTRADLVERGKAGRLAPEDMRGSTFTLSSLGMFGVEEFTAIINQPESAILAVGAILDKPVAVGKDVAIRPVMKLTLSYDHRIIDGARAAAFLKTLRELIENPILILA